eukprot:scaffold11801_cov65-Cyclotella_meneghiniana.AAC.1
MSYDFHAAQEAMAFLPSANHAQIFQHPNVAGANPPSQKSPLKSEYKAMPKKKVIEVESLNSLTSDLKSDIVYNYKD